MAVCRSMALYHEGSALCGCTHSLRRPVQVAHSEEWLNVREVGSCLSKGLFLQYAASGLLGGGMGSAIACRL